MPAYAWIHAWLADAKRQRGTIPQPFVVSRAFADLDNLARHHGGPCRTTASSPPPDPSTGAPHCRVGARPWRVWAPLGTNGLEVGAKAQHPRPFVESARGPFDSLRCRVGARSWRTWAPLGTNGGKEWRRPVAQISSVRGKRPRPLRLASLPSWGSILANMGAARDERGKEWRRPVAQIPSVRGEPGLRRFGQSCKTPWRPESNHGRAAAGCALLGRSKRVTRASRKKISRIPADGGPL